MNYKTFEEYWKNTWTKLPNQPEIMDVAFREVAEKAWNAGKTNGYGEGYSDGMIAGYGEGHADGTNEEANNRYT